MKEKATAFAVGATGYPCIEILARGHTHWCMALLGGICVLALVWIARRYPGMNIAVQAALGTAFITAAELAVGLVVNRALGWQVWDYSREFGNVPGTDMPPVQLLLVSAVPARVRPAASGRTLESQARV